MNNAVRTHDTDKRNSVGLLTGLLFGTLTGFGAMMLFAPQSGRKTRAQIGLKNIELHDRATDTYDDLVTLSRFDNRKFLTGTLGLTVTKNKHAAGKAIENLSSRLTTSVSGL